MITDVKHSTNDVALERRILNYLRQRNLNELELEARDGRVILRGTVSQSWMRRRYVDCCRSVVGVLDVIDRLVVKDSAPDRNQLDLQQNASVIEDAYCRY
jgi:osmotically-inducible protein OsmY